MFVCSGEKIYAGNSLFSLSKDRLTRLLFLRKKNFKSVFSHAKQNHGKNSGGTRENMVVFPYLKPMV